ncbi:putative PRONE domain-containing protein [Medicago truncatula]|uniref:Putative PRONE domain-containing protein n=1 Tax=Medicago truncatula TaxID=3880 RepID=F6LPV1_MEDTR|nr:rho guanine nucleotide exchange factor 8 [Medicago truncatula]AEE89673.1 RopGEF8 [Medicago truncatula]AES76825.2 RHO guanyl-nucleotide exchange factor [Medicago truncatula]RHN52926.1 putative PRONE domain-containing protein [Medicago truncatula]
MVRAFNHQFSMQKSRSFHFRKMFEIPGKHIQGLFDKDHDEGSDHSDHKVHSKSFESARYTSDIPLETQPIGVSLNINNDHIQEAVARMPPKPPPTESDLMKERFAKLLLGEDMSGAGNGVSSALALSNAITNLAASVFGEQSKLEPMSQERKTRWRKEIEWLLSVTDHIVEFAPSQQLAKDGSTMEIMTTRQRSDLLMNIPALRKLDAMLLDILDNFRDQNEFWYVSKSDEEAEGNTVTQRKSDKWWLPIVKVPPTGLSDVAVKWIQFEKDNVNQVLKAAMAINAQVLSEMEIPDNYIESLPKNGRESLGESIYKCITVEYFDPGQFLSTMDMTTEHKVLDLKNRIEASIVIWKRKMNKDGKSSWSSAISMEKRELFEERAETILLMIKQEFPGLPQSSLDISKIQYNKDVGQAILESYSRVIESLAYTVLSRIDDVLYVDSMTKNPSLAASSRRFSLDSLPMSDQTSPNSEDSGIGRMSSSDTPPSMTLSDFMGWTKGDLKRTNSTSDLEDLKEKDEKVLNKLGTPKKNYYLDKLEYLNAIRSPIARH